MIKEVLIDMAHDPEVYKVNLLGLGGLTTVELMELKIWFGLAVAGSVILYNITKMVLAILEHKRKGKL